MKIVARVKVIQNQDLKDFERNVENFLAKIKPEYQINYQHEPVYNSMTKDIYIYHFATISYFEEVDDNE